MWQRTLCSAAWYRWTHSLQSSSFLLQRFWVQVLGAVYPTVVLHQLRRVQHRVLNERGYLRERKVLVHGDDVHVEMVMLRPAALMSYSTSESFRCTEDATHKHHGAADAILARSL